MSDTDQNTKHKDMNESEATGRVAYKAETSLYTTQKELFKKQSAGEWL